jgi:hypothetical protein
MLVKNSTYNNYSVIAKRYTMPWKSGSKLPNVRGKRVLKVLQGQGY